MKNPTSNKPIKTDPMTQAMRGFELFQQEQYQQALDVLNPLIASHPYTISAYMHRARVYQALEKWGEMVADLTRAQELDPTNADVHFKVAGILLGCMGYIQAIQALSRAVECQPEFEEAWIMLADCYYRIGSAESARNVYLEALKKFPENRTAQFDLACMLSPIAASQEEIDTQRREMLENLDRLMQQNFTFTHIEAEIKSLPFYHSYHGRNNKELMEKLARFFLQSFPSLAYVAPHTQQPLVKKEKPKIGFIFDLKQRNVLSQFLLTLLEGIVASEHFQIVLFISNAIPDEPTLLEFTANIPHYLLLPKDLAHVRETIAREEVDMLIYTEIGTGMQSYFYAFARLAPIQCNMGTHPVTSGIPTLDYHFSFKHCEPANAQEHYSEQLVLFERNLAVFKRPDIPPVIMNRSQLGLPERGRLYCCPVILFKIHPDMDRIFSEILTRDPEARLILFDSPYKTLWRARLEKRFAQRIKPEHIGRILFLPHASKDIFFQVLHNVDAILDTLHFSFGTTAFLTLSANLPFVTWPGEFARGRGPYMMYTQMGMTDLIAPTHDAYIELALRLANDRDFRTAMSEKIRNHSNVLYNDRSAINLFSTRLKELYDAHTRA